MKIQDKISEYVVIVYKEVGKEPEFRKIKNTIQEFESLVGGEIAITNYEDDFVIVHKKNNSNLMANVYINTDFLEIGLSIRGTIFAINKNIDGKFSSLTKEQAIKCRELFMRESFNYENFDKKGRYIGNCKNIKEKSKMFEMMSLKKNNSFTNKTQKQKEFERDLQETSSCNKENESFEAEEILKMILSMQSVILTFIKNTTE